MAIGLRRDENSPAWQILEYLQRNGSATIKELEQFLGVTTTAVRQHLAALQAENLIERRTIHSGVGRPHHAYFANENARQLFACHCDDLALTMLDEMYKMEGEQRVAQLLARVSDRLANRYARAVQSPVLHERVQEMAAALGEQGVLTEVTPRDDDTIVLKTYNCPYHELAQEYREICDMDQEMIQQVLGSEVALSACIMNGDGGCSFVVTRNTPASDPQETVEGLSG
jgi:predicted ArsR family transcriptional regulator